MAVPHLIDDNASDAVLVGRHASDQLWPIRTNWRAILAVQGEWQSPEWVLERVKPVPLSSRSERALLEAVRNDDGRTVLTQASEPGEHRVSAAVIAALRLASTHPERALRFLSWLQSSPDDPRNLRFLRRYLPQLSVLVQLEPDIGVAMAIGHTSLRLLEAELLRADGQLVAAAKILDSLAPSAAVAVATASLRVALGALDEANALSADRPIVDDLSAALRVVHSRALELSGLPDEALADLAPVLAFDGLSRPVERAALAVRGRALRATGRDVEAGLVESDLGISDASPGDRHAAVPQAAPEPPLFGRSVADALDDAWARVRRQPGRSADAKVEFDPELVAARSEEALALIARGNLEAAEGLLLADLDCADDWVDAGHPVADDFFVLLAGLFDQQLLSAEEIATLERLRSAHQRAGTALPAEVEERLVQVRATLDALS